MTRQRKRVLALIAETLAISGADGRIRTADLLITNHIFAISRSFPKPQIIVKILLTFKELMLILLIKGH